MLRPSLKPFELILQSRAPQSLSRARSIDPKCGASILHIEDTCLDDQRKLEELHLHNKEPWESLDEQSMAPGIAQYTLSDEAIDLMRTEDL